MSAGLSIYYVPPRLMGKIDRWSGQRRPSPILQQVQRLGMNAVWLSPFHPVSRVEKQKHGAVQTGSLYAMRDHFRMGAEFSTGSDRRDSLHLKNFTAQAAAQGVTVMADLVFNHVAADHPLVEAETKEIALLRRVAGKQGIGLAPLYGREGDVSTDQGHGPLVGWRADGALKLPTRLASRMDGQDYHIRFRRNPDGSPFIDGPAEDPWSDAVKINYDSPEGYRYFVTGSADQPGYWQRTIDWYVDHGFTGFRCDVAYAVPPRVWSVLVQHAHDKLPGVVFMGETIGGGEQVNQLEHALIKDKDGKPRKAFDLGMHGQFWWDYRDGWYAGEEVAKNRRAARFGGAAFPDNHDTPDTIAGALRKQHGDSAEADRIIADTLVRDWAVAALTGNSAYLQMGYEYAREMQNEVFKGHGDPADWRKLVADRDKPGHVLNLTSRIAAINKLKSALGVENCVADLSIGKTHYDGRVGQLDVTFRDAESGQVVNNLTLLLNLQPEKGAVEVNAPHHAGLLQNGRQQLHKSAAEQADPMRLTDIMVIHDPPKPSLHNSLKWALLGGAAKVDPPKLGNS